MAVPGSPLVAQADLVSTCTYQYQLHLAPPRAPDERWREIGNQMQSTLKQLEQRSAYRWRSWGRKLQPLAGVE